MQKSFLIRKYPPTHFFQILKVSRSRNKIVEPITSPKNERTNLFFYPDNSEILETWISISSFKYFRVVRIEKQICPFVFWENLQLDNFVSRSTDLYLEIEKMQKTIFKTKFIFKGMCRKPTNIQTTRKQSAQSTTAHILTQ